MPRRDFFGPLLGLGFTRLPSDLGFGLGRQGPDQRVHEVAGPPTVGGRDGVQLVPTHGVELGALEFAPLVVGLVDRDHDRGGRAAQDLGGLDIRRRHPGRGIHHEDDHVGFTDRQSGLVLDAGLDGVVRVEFEPAGVHDDEAPAVPLRVAVEPVARRAGPILHDGGPATDDPIEQRALADVRPSDDRDDRDPGT